MNYAPERTGIAPYTTAIAERLATRGDQVRVLTAFPHYPEWHFTDGGTERTKRTTTGGVQLMRMRHRLPRAGSSLSRLASEVSFGFRALTARWGRPDVVVLVSPAMFASAMLSWRVRLRRGRRLVVWVQDLYGSGVHETRAGDRYGLAERMVVGVERAMLRAADGVAVIHERIVDELTDLGVDRDRVAVVRNWSHVATATRTSRGRTRDRCGWGADETIVLHTGNMGAKQDLGNVVEAARLADRAGLPVRFVLMGDGNTRARLEATAEDVERITVVDPEPASRYMDTLRAADVLLVNEHPSMRSSALPSKLTSYFASGRPVLAATSADSLTAAELDRAETGARVDPGQPAELLSAVQALAAEPLRMRRLADRAKRYRQAYLTEDAATGAFVALLDRVLGRAAPESTPPPARNADPARLEQHDLDEESHRSKAG